MLPFWPLLAYAVVVGGFFTCLWLLINYFHEKKYEKHWCPTCGHMYESKKGTPIDWAKVKEDLTSGKGCGMDH